MQNEWVPLHLREKLSFIHILGIAAANLAPSILWMVTPAFLEPISNELDVSQIWKTIILFLSSFAGFSVCPIVGIYSDRCTFKWGRRRIYMVISLFLIIIGFIILTYCSEIGEFLKPNDSKTIKQVIFISSYLFVIFAGNALQTPARSICSDVTPIHQQNLMANICSVFAGLGGFLVNIVGGLKLEKYLKISQLKFILIVSCVFCTISVLLTVIVTPEEPLLNQPPKIRLFREMYQSFKVMPKPMLRVLASLLLSTMANYQFSFEFNHFMGKDIYHGDNSNPNRPDLIELYEDGITWSMICGAVRYGTQFLYGLVCTRISEIIGFKWTSFIGYLFDAICFVMFFFVNNRYSYLGIVVGPGIGYGKAFSTIRYCCN